VPTGTSSSEPPLTVRRPRPGPPAKPEDLRRAQQRQQLLRTELSRVRTAAAAWRNGLGVLLAGLVGFGLIKGRSDVSTLTPAAAIVVGILLLLALLAGAMGALWLLRASFGRPSVVTVGLLPPGPVSEHQEALASARGLRRGIAATIACAALLVGAVGITWYGPPRAEPALLVNTGTGSVCGSVAGVSAGILMLETADGEDSIWLDSVLGMRPVDSCP
jgi:hypothetical protein